MEITEQFIIQQAPNAAAVQNGRKLSQKGSFSGLCKTADGSLYWGDCAGSGKNPYRVSGDWSGEAPIFRCSCPSRQFPCKHALGLMFEMLAGKDFAEAGIPEDIAGKRAKIAAKAAKKEAEAENPPKPKKASTAARKKKIAKQLEGLDMADKMVDELLTAGVGTLAGSSAQSYDKLAKDLGSYYLTGPQVSFSRLARTVQGMQKEPENAHFYTAEALRILIALRSVLKKSRVFLEQKLEAEQFSADDNVLFEALGGIWRLDELLAIGSVKKGAKLVQLSFDVSVDEAKDELVERGFWVDIETGHIDQTLNLRPLKRLKYVKADDSCFSLMEIPTLYYYPGEGCRRIRWETGMPRTLAAEDFGALLKLASAGVAESAKEVKNLIKNMLLPKYAPVMLPVGKLGRVGGEFVLEDAAGGRIALRDRAEDGKGHQTVYRLAHLPSVIPAGSAVFGLMFYDGSDHSLCLHPYSIVTPDSVIRLLF